MTNDDRVATISLEGDNLIVTAQSFAVDRRARLFFRSVLGGEGVEGGWSCHRRRLSVPVLILRVYDWLQQNGYEVERHGIAEQTIARELERRRSFLRTREAAGRLRSGNMEFDFTAVEAALDSFGWSPERTLRPHQRAGVGHALTAVNAANFSVPGSGKTATTLAVAVTHLHANTVDLVVVVGPLASFGPWEQETDAAVGSRIRVRRIRGGARQRRDAYADITRGEILLLSYATITVDLPILYEVLSSWRVMLVVDESHRIKRFRGGIWAPALLEVARRARVRIILSGTPMPQSGIDLYNQLNVLWPDGQLTGTRDAFATRVSLDFGDIVRDVLPFVSRTPKSALGLRPPIVMRHEVPIVGTQAEIYQLIANQFRRQLQDADTWRDKLEALRRGRPIRLLQAAANPDLFNVRDSYFRLPRLQDATPTLMESLATYKEHETAAKSVAALTLINGIAKSGGKVVCWSNFVANLDQFRQLVHHQLGLPCYQIDGRVPAGHDALHVEPASEAEEPGDVDTRESIIHRFLEHEGPAVLVTNPASCSESISLHRSCHNAIYIDRTYDCALFLQSIDRIHRLGLPSDVTVTIHILLATVQSQPTVDQLVDQSLEAKSDRMRQLLEGAELAPINISTDPAVDAEGNEEDLAAILRYLLGETV
ncbi:MAG: DEAD/DEAH box helicase [Candidatus Latescibacteria bacterium]|nr:DEAD/DEAH box helicase [Candidatus Latescibacterota bacterium]